MNKRIQRTSIKNMSYNQWKDWRMNGIGCSEISTVLGLNEYKDRVRLFYEKVGAIDNDFDGNIATFSGRALEDTVVKEFWKYWNPLNPTVEEMIKNGEDKKAQRKCKNYYAFLVNPDYPWLFASLDRSINACNGNPEGVLEIKTAETYAANKWEGGINPGYVLQVQGNFICTELNHGEIFLLKNGRYPECFIIKESKEIQQNIIDQTFNFWEAVLEGRSIWNDDSISSHQKWQMLANIQPEPSSIEDHNKFLKEQYQSDYQINKVVSSEEINSYLSDYIEAQVKSKEEKDKQTIAQSKIMEFMKKNDADELEYNGELLCSWRVAANGHPKFLPKKKAILELCQQAN